MKTTLLTCLIIFNICKSYAQLDISVPEVPTMAARISVEEESRQMQRTLMLNENQFLKIKEINKDRREKIDAITSMFPHEPEKRDQKIAELEIQYDQEFGAVLDKRQMAEYLELHGRGELTTFKSVAIQEKPEKKPESPSFNDQIHSIIQKATAPKDTSKIAAEEILQTDSLMLGESLYDGSQKDISYTRSGVKSEKAKEKLAQVAARQPAKAQTSSPNAGTDSLAAPAKIAGKPTIIEVPDSTNQATQNKTAPENSGQDIAKPGSMEKGVSATFEP